MRISDWSSDVCSSDLTATARATRPTRPKPRPTMPGPAATRMAIASTKAPSGTRARIRRKTLAFNAVLPSTSGRDAAGAPTPLPRVVGKRAHAHADALLHDFAV